jgi:hypothetical protein
MDTPVDFDRIAVEELPQARRIAEWMSAWHSKASILDVGCGPGLYVEEMRKRGLEAFGVDSDERLVESEWLKRIDITMVRYDTPIYNVALSLEVGEHIPAGEADLYVEHLADTGATILYFSAARPGQGGEGHINCQPKAYWVKRLHYAGFWLDPDTTDEWLGFMRSGPHMGWLTQNGLVFRR